MIIIIYVHLISVYKKHDYFIKSTWSYVSYYSCSLLGFKIQSYALGCIRGFGSFIITSPWLPSWGDQDLVCLPAAISQGPAVWIQSHLLAFSAASVMGHVFLVESETMTVRMECCTDEQQECSLLWCWILTRFEEADRTLPRLEFTGDANYSGHWPGLSNSCWADVAGFLFHHTEYRWALQLCPMCEDWRGLVRCPTQFGPGTWWKWKSERQRSDQVIFHCTTSPHLVKAACWLSSADPCFLCFSAYLFQ